MRGMLRTGGVTVILSMACLLIWTNVIRGDAPDGVAGSLYYRDGRQVPFLYFGRENRVGQMRIAGRLGEQKVNYALSELGEVHLVNADSAYNSGDSAEVLVVSRNGSRFTLTNVHFYLGGSDKRHFRFVYLDPITKKLTNGSDSVTTISHVVMGEKTGPIKRNLTTGEFFPAIYNFDPFTGEKLQWTDKPVSGLKKG